jgi:hypothetical protein
MKYKYKIKWKDIPAEYNKQKTKISELEYDIVIKEKVKNY